MAYCSVPKDLTRVKSRLVFNLDARQLICFGAAAVVGVPTFLLTKGAIGNSAAVFLMIGIMLPFFFFAMFERDGQPAEKILRNILRAKLWPGTRPYKTENLYNYLNEEGGEAFVGQEKAQTGAGSAKGRKPGSREAYGRKAHGREARETYRGRRKAAR